VQLTEDLTKAYITVLSASVDLAKTIKVDEDGKAWIALTGATGGLSQQQLIFSWRVWELK